MEEEITERDEDNEKYIIKQTCISSNLDIKWLILHGYIYTYRSRERVISYMLLCRDY